MSNELIKVEEFSSIMKTAPGMLQRNQQSVEGANNAGQTLLDTIEANGGMNDALDAQVASYLNKIKVTKDNMEARRKPLTQLFDQMRKVFTSLEGEVDTKNMATIPGRLVDMRNRYASQKIAEEKKRQAEALRMQNFNNEKASYKSSLELALSHHYNDFFNNKSALISQVWSNINFANFAEKAKIIQEWPLIYPQEHFNMFRDTFCSIYLDPETKAAIKAEVMRGKYDSFAKQYRFDMEDLRQSYIDRLPSLQKELEETERIQRVNAEEAKRIEAERKQKELEEQTKRDLEARQQQERAKAEAEASAQASQMNSLFDSAAAATIAPTPVKAKITEKIQVLHPAGIIEIYQMWWINEGQNLPIDELEKIHKKMITFCEKKANKDDERIKSQYVQYIEDVKAK